MKACKIGKGLYEKDRILYDYLNKPPSKPLNKLNVNAIGEINVITEKYAMIMKKTTIILKLLEEVDEFVLTNQWLKIMVSLKNQKDFITFIKSSLKSKGLTKEQHRAVIMSVNAFSKRMDFIINNIFPEYVILTPLKEYEEQLEKQGLTLDEVINKELINNIDLDVYDRDIELKNFAKKIIDSVANCDEYKERLAKYMEFKKNKIEKMKKERKQESTNRKKAMAENNVIQKANQARKSIYRNLYCYGDVQSQVIFLKKRGHINGKIIICSKVNAGEKGAAYYVSFNNELTSSLSKAKVFTEYDTIPSPIQEMIDNDIIVISEVIIPL